MLVKVLGFKGKDGIGREREIAMLNHVHCMCGVHFNIPLDFLHCFMFSEQLG